MFFWSRRKRDSLEARYLRGELSPRTDRPSVLYFTLHKCASVYLGKKLHKLARKIGLAPLDLDGHFFDSGRPQAFAPRPRGFFYGPIRSYDEAYGTTRQWPSLADYKVLVVLRDPRDVLTSLYYSMAYSHAIPRGEGNEQLVASRREALAVDINDFVRQQADVFARRYRAYFELARRQPVHLATYERLVASPDAWLDDLLAYLGVRLSRWNRRGLISQRDFRVHREDPKAHVRQVTPGDHRRKLKPETIAWLDTRFADVLAWYEKQPLTRHAA
jgi:hypothetical protein